MLSGDSVLEAGAVRGQQHWGPTAEAGVELSLHPFQAGDRPEPRLLGAGLGAQVGPESASWATGSSEHGDRGEKECGHRVPVSLLLPFCLGDGPSAFQTLTSAAPSLCLSLE